MKRITSLLVAALATSTLAQSTKDWSFSLSSTAALRYVGPLGGATFIDKPVWQTGVTAFNKNGFYFGAWVSKPFNQRYARTFANETDLYAGFSRTLGAWSLDLSTAVYDLLPTGDLYAVNLTITATGGRIRPYAKVEHDFAQRSDLMPGTVYKFGLCGGIDRLPLCWDVSLLGNCGPNPYGGKEDRVSAGRLQLGWPIKAGAGTWTPGLVLQQKFGRTGGITRDQTFWQLAYTFGF